jgi:hypothetical protein
VVCSILENDEVIGNVVGLFERKDDVIVDRTAQGIHALLSLAENLSEIVSRLDAIESHMIDTNQYETRSRASSRNWFTDEGLAKPIKAIGISSQSGQERKRICP